jgi:hypothetical protein
VWNKLRGLKTHRFSSLDVRTQLRPRPHPGARVSPRLPHRRESIRLDPMRLGTALKAFRVRRPVSTYGLVAIVGTCSRRTNVLNSGASRISSNIGPPNSSMMLACSSQARCSHSRVCSRSAKRAYVNAQSDGETCSPRAARTSRSCGEALILSAPIAENAAVNPIRAFNSSNRFSSSRSPES